MKNEKRVLIRSCPPLDQEFSRKAPPPPMLVSDRMTEIFKKTDMRGLFSIPHEEVMAFLKRFNTRYPEFQLWNSKPKEVKRDQD